MRLKLHSGERLKSRKTIGRLFSKQAKSSNSYPIRAVYAMAEERRNGFPVQVTFVVPKRRFKKAVDRNRIKRMMREAFRLNKHILALPGAGQQLAPHSLGVESGREEQLAILFMYTGTEEMDFSYIERKMKKVLAGVKV